MRPFALVFDPEFHAVVKSPNFRVTTKSQNFNSRGLRDGRRGGRCPGRHVRQRGALMAVFGWTVPRCLRIFGGRGYAPSGACRHVSRRCAFCGRSLAAVPPSSPATPWEQNQDQTGIAVAATGQLGRERNRDKSGIGWTSIGSKSPSRAADSSIVPDHDVDPYKY